MLVLLRDLNPGPPAPKARIIPVDQRQLMMLSYTVYYTLSMQRRCREIEVYLRGGSRFVGRGSQSVVVICRSTYEPGRGGRLMCCSTYRRVNISRLLMGTFMFTNT